MLNEKSKSFCACVFLCILLRMLKQPTHQSSLAGFDTGNSFVPKTAILKCTSHFTHSSYHIRYTSFSYQLLPDSTCKYADRCSLSTYLKMVVAFIILYIVFHESCLIQERRRHVAFVLYRMNRVFTKIKIVLQLNFRVQNLNLKGWIREVDTASSNIIHGYYKLFRKNLFDPQGKG